MAALVWVIFDGPPSHESGRFVEVEDGHGRSAKAGEWSKDPRQEGWWKLGPFLSVLGLENRLAAALLSVGIGVGEAQRLAEGVTASLTASAVPTEEVLELIGEQRAALQEQLHEAEATPGGISPDTAARLHGELEVLDWVELADVGGEEPTRMQLTHPLPTLEVPDPMRHVRAVFGSSS